MTKKLVILNELMVSIEDLIGEKLEWQIFEERGQVLVDETSLTIMYEEILRLRNELVAKRSTT